jgi:hypothetical protein
MARHEDDDDDDRPRSRGRDDDEEDDDRPRRKKRRDDDDDFDDRPRRKKSEGGGSKIVMILVIVFVVLLLVCGLGGYLVYFSMGKVREAAARVNEQNNMKQVSLGLINHSQANGRPPRADGDISWRVHVLPYIEQGALHNQFDTNSAWNKGRNQQLGETIIKTYQSPLDDPPTNQTHYRVFTGEGSSFDTNLWGRPYPSFLQDGTSNTIMIIETAETVPWSAPKEVLLQKGGQFPEFGHPKRPQVLVATWDGAVKTSDKKGLDAAKIRALATAAGGEAIGEW